MSELVNVLLVGGGAREHALAWKLRQSARLGELWTTHPDNPGLAALARPVDVPVAVREIYRLKQFCEHKRIGLVVIGPEDPLAEGYADALAAPGRAIFGPVAAGARLESDKAWSKALMRSASIPTGEARVFHEPAHALSYLESRVADDPALKRLFEEVGHVADYSDKRAMIDRHLKQDRELAAAYIAPQHDLPVIKASGLAKGKGVIVPSSFKEAADAIDRIMARREFGDAGKSVLIEERLEGKEVSVLAIVDGRTIMVLPVCQDHKRLRDNDAGPNTGGMGAFCPSTLVDDETMDRIVQEVLVPTLDALHQEEIEYRGVIYAGIMLTHAGPKVLEYNARFGDPECQPLMMRLTSDLIDLLMHASNGTLEEAIVEWDPSPSVCVVLASGGYPEKPRTGDAITGLDEAAKVPGVMIFHAGTKRGTDGAIVTNGGRVLSVTAIGSTFEEARTRAYAAADMIQFTGKHMRRDIGLSELPARR